MWRKITIGIIITITIIMIGYDIVVVINSPSDTISNVMMSTIWRFPFIIYCWLGLAGHFLSLIKTKKLYLKQLVIVSSVVLALSFLTLFGVIPVNAKLLAIVSGVGFISGMVFWSQRRSKL